MTPTQPPRLIATDVAANPANDSGVRSRVAIDSTADLNEVVSTLAGRLMPMLAAHGVDLELDMARGLPLVRGTPDELAFAIAGVVAGELRSLEGAEHGRLRVETRAEGSRVSVAITADCVPLLQLVRAILASDDRDGRRDPTMMHCRRLVERHGGAIELVEGGDGLLGFRLVFQALSRSYPLGVVPIVEHLTRATGTALAVADAPIAA